ncbi:MAG: hypothetical protein LBM28_04885 [Oscillospiraceae bacterium]|jgi:guanylate kinase|nr:hypothetical protein [Oscillospiraceae bacterium]
MPKLIIINGASGAGKTYLLETISHKDSSMSPIKKLTTRKPRSYESIGSSPDLYFASVESDIKALEYSYEFNGEWYGISKTHIDDALIAGKYPLVIVRDYPTITKLISDYPKQSLAFYIQGIYSDSKLKIKLLDQGRDSTDVEENIRRNKTNFDLYIEYLQKDLFDRCIFNYYDDTFLKQMEYFVEKDRKSESRR